MLKPAKSLPCVDEKSPPEDPYEDDGIPTSFEADKAKCQKYIGQLMWLTTRTRPDIASAPKPNISAMAEGYATSIFLFDTLSELGLVSGSGPSALMSMKTDSAVALKQLGTQSVTVRTRTAAQKLNYLRELI